MKSRAQYILLALALLVLMVSSCVRVPLSPRQNDNIVSTRLRVQWGSVSVHPQTLTVFSARTERELHYIYTYRCDRPDSVYDERVVRGNYYTAAVGAEKGFSVPQAETFRAEHNYPLRDVCVHADLLVPESVPASEQPTALLDSLAKRFSFPEGMVFDDQFPKTRTLESGRSVFYAMNRCYMDPQEITDVALAPRDITADIEFRLPVVLKDAGAELIYVLGSVTGVPDRFSLLDGCLSMENTGRCFFRMTQSSDGSYSGSIRTLGLFSPGSASFTGGTGIFTAYLFIRYPSTSTEYTVRVVKNLWQELNTTSFGNSLLVRVGESELYRLQSGRAIVQMPTVSVTRTSSDPQFGWEQMPDIEIDDDEMNK